MGVSEKAGQSLADPNEYKNLFPDFDKTLAAEKVLGKERQRKMPASMFTSIPEDIKVSEDEGEEFSSPVPEHEPEPVEPVKAHISPKPTRKAPPEKEPVGIDPDDLEAELEKDLGGLDLGDVDTTGVDLDDDDLLEDDDS